MYWQHSPKENQLCLPQACLLLLFVLVALWRHHVGSNLPLSVDEAYYIAWSKSLDWGYWTKPPVIAWAINAARTVCGETAGCVRVTSLIAFPMTSLVLLVLCYRMIKSWTSACITSALFTTLPFSSFYGIAATTDGFLVLFWACAMLCLWLALEGKFWAWPLLGLSFGLGLLSKYTMVVFGLSAVLILFHPQWRFAWKTKGPYLALAITLLVFAPNISWNLEHQMPTFQHTADISKGGNAYGWHWDTLAKFLFEQVLIGNPLLVFGTTLALIGHIKKPHPVIWFSLSSSLPILLVICAQALLSRAHANWASPAFLGICLMATYHYWPLHKKILIAAFSFNVLVAATLYHYEMLVAKPFKLKGTIAADPFWALRGWPELTKKIEQMLAAQQSNRNLWLVASEDRAVLSQIQALLNIPAGHAMGWSNGAPDNHFDQHFPLPAQPLEPVLLITQLPSEKVIQRYPSAIKQSEIQINTVYEKLSYQVWWLGLKSQE